MGLLDRIMNRTVTVSKYKMITDEGQGFYNWDGKLYQSDIVRSAIRPKAQAIGKTVGKHIRKDVGGLTINPDAYIRFLLEEPNPYMTGQMLQEKLATQLELNNNAFAFISRDTNNMPTEIYPISSNLVKAIENNQGQLFLEFTLKNGRTVTFKYTDIIHLRKDFNDSDIFGDSPAEALAPLMEIVNTSDQGIVKAIKNSNVIKWLLKFNQTLRPEDLKAATKQFIDDYMNIESDTVGAAATDAKADAQQVDPKDYVLNFKQSEATVNRIYSFFNTNEKIIQGSYTEDQWISYYEASIEPIVLQLSGEYTRKVFSRRERGFGNKIVFESSNLTFASMTTKLRLVSFVDRGILSPNEVREILNLIPIEGGDVFIRRLDTVPIEEVEEDKKEDNEE